MHGHDKRMPAASKPAPGPGISPAEFQALKAKVDQLEKLVTDALGEKNLWNGQLRTWQDQKTPLTITLLNGEGLKGKVSWIDRYTIGLELDPVGGLTIIHKGAVATISDK